MAFQKHGTGDVLKDEDVKKTASTDDANKEARLAALKEENEENDG